MIDDDKFPLFVEFPELKDLLPREKLIQKTPVQKMENLEAKVGAKCIWIKRDDQTTKLYGGNKPRKLEFIYAAFFIVSTILFIPVTLLLTVVSGYLFGVVPGALYATASATIGGMILFLLVRYLFGQTVQKKFSRQAQRFSDEIRECGYSYVLMLQLLPVTPTPVINLVAGLSPLSCWTFVWASFIGMLPSGFIYAFAGQQIAHIRSVHDIISCPMFIVLVLLAAGALFIPYALRYMGLTKR